jgi:hypothetical protein
MANTIRRAALSGGASIVLAGSAMLGLHGVAAASQGPSPISARPVAASATIPLAQAEQLAPQRRCWPVWHRGYWQWERRPDWFHGRYGWNYHWIRVWHPSWPSWDCR